MVKIWIISANKFEQSFISWDSIFYVTIMTDDYQILKINAFFPLFPYFLKLVNFVFIQNTITAYLIINFLIGLLNTQLLYKISINIIHDQKIAFCSCLFFIVNPSTVFFNSLYSENIFTMLTFISLYYYSNVRYFYVIYYYIYKSCLINLVFINLKIFTDIRV